MRSNKEKERDSIYRVEKTDEPTKRLIYLDDLFIGYYNPLLNEVLEA